VAAFFVVLLAYLIGCFSTAYYLVRWRTGQDIRALGSGTAGARNAGRILGKRGFVLVFAGDVLKGALAVWIAQWLGLPTWGVAAVMVAVVLGHLFPVQLAGQGGKGAATAFGAVGAVNWQLALLCVAVAALAFMLTRNTMASGLIAFVAAVPLAFLLAMPLALCLGVLSIVLLLLIAHRENVRALRQSWRLCG
jgi:glycerol-3-phosphate acyltransferase PlsY